jgi:hypothetical protein
VRQANETAWHTRRVQRRGIDCPRAIIHTANAIQRSCDLVSRRVHGHGNRPSQTGGHTLEAVASAQQRFMLQRNLGNKYPMDGRFEVYVTMRQWMECCACKLRGRGYFDQPGWCGHKIDGSIRGGVRLRPQARTGAIGGYCRLIQVGLQASHRIRQRRRWTHWAAYGSVRGCIRGHSGLAVVVQRTEWQRLGVPPVRKVQDKSCNVRWTRDANFRAVRCDRIAGAHA